MKLLPQSLLLSGLLFSGVAFAQADVVAPTPLKVAVMPFAALSGDIPQRAGTKASGMLANELKNLEGLELIDIKRTGPSGPGIADKFSEGLSQARNTVQQAVGLRKQRKFRLAEEALVKALADYQANAAGLTDVAEFSDAWALLSAVQFNTGRDDEGQKSLTTAVSLSPARDLPLAQTSALFTRVVLDTRKAVQLGPKGSIKVESMPPAAAVLVDGVALGVTPLDVREVPPGIHVWRVLLPSGEAVGGAVEVHAGKQLAVSAQTTGTDPESRVLAQMGQNKLDADVVKAVTEQAKSLDADYLIFGALSRDGKNLALDSFLFAKLTNEVKRLPRSTFDTELLSAGMEFYNLAGELLKQGAKLGAQTRIPGPVSNENLGETTKVVQAVYGVKAGQADVLDGTELPGGDKASGPRAPLEPKKRKPLKR